MAVQKMSKSVYVGMCKEIGTPQQAAYRREIANIREIWMNKVNERGSFKSMRSGSYREGFSFNDSDIDIMLWPTDHRVFWDFPQFYNTRKEAPILCDSSESPAGFTLLWLPLKRSRLQVLSSCVWRNGRLYISSSKYRENQLLFSTPDSSTHGPCSSGKVGFKEYDEAHCFVSDYWPPLASSWINRCHSWPPPNVVTEIVGNGCHFVAIGHKLGYHEDNEWRISFSRAEYKLVHSMNHTQFLTYGLLKVFLKEILNSGQREEENLLCSYHMKTAIFWAIQQKNLFHWCPQNLLVGFWVCFKLILKWVYEGICPNFFIPQNNMFLNNIHGQSQSTLFMRLYGLYDKGIALLLHSPSIRSSIIDVLCNPRLTVCTDEHTLISEAEYDADLFIEIQHSDAAHTSDLQDCITVIRTVEKLIGSPLTQYQVLGLQKHTATILQRITFNIHEKYRGTIGNKQLYTVDKSSCQMLKLAAKFGSISDLLYIAMYYYRTLRYKKALSVLEMARVKYAQPYLMFRGNVDIQGYSDAVGGQSFTRKMRQTAAMYIILSNQIVYIDELILEQQSNQDRKWTVLFIPPVVMFFMLEFLCYKHVDTRRAQSALDDLQAIVHHDKNRVIDVVKRDISWEILGICHQIAGNLQAALYSYQQSLRQYSLNHIQSATIQRIRDLQLHT
ncbi:uncharacterized protein [Magallana gigas]|uniref:uncharacterized protein n=1 Tax=Magallana gigas TaxID=29159 RepID=UPI003342B385